MAAVMEQASIVDGWCPSCRQTSVVGNDGACAWCGSQTGAGRVEPTPTRNVNGGVPVAMSDQVLDEAHRLYAAGASMREVAEQLHERTGYRSVATFTEALYRFFAYRGWPRRDQRQVTAHRNFRHGRKARSNTPAEDYAYRRWLRAQRRVQCEADRVRGGRCTRTAIHGERYCTAHHPDYIAANEARLERMRERLAETSTACAGTVLYGRRKGQPCLRRATSGEAYCPVHRQPSTSVKEG